MPIRLYNSLTKTKEDFAPIDPANVRMYVCGPTVYDFAHIGNARPAIVFDVLYRLLKHTYEKDGGKVTYVRNITDVDDKINARALRDYPDLPLNDAIRVVTEKTEAQYQADVTALGCLPPAHQPRATEFVLPRADGKPDMVTLIKQLIARGHAYQAGGEVLFDTQSMPDYGALSGRNLDEQKEGARVAVDAHKKHPHDFVLWKLSAEDEPGWESPWGRGRPGWHIECSAMSAAYLGNEFDIHGGGLDLIFPHHENEIAQSRCAHGTPVMANYWMHNGFLQVEGEKMSKSLGNFFTIRELLSGSKLGGRSWPGQVLRLAMLKTHYRRPIDWTGDGVEEAFVELRNWSNALSNFRDVLSLIGRQSAGLLGRPNQTVIDALSDDLNFPEALAVMRALFNQVAEGKSSAAVDLAETCEFLGLLNLEKLSGFNTYHVGVGGKLLPQQFKPEMDEIQTAFLNSDDRRIEFLKSKLLSESIRVKIQNNGALEYEVLGNVQGVDRVFIQRLVDARTAARTSKNWAESDRIRDELLDKGIVLIDEPGGTRWEVKR